MSPLFPAMNQFAYQQLSPAAFPHLNVADGYTELQDLMALRSGTFTSLQLRNLQGIIAFPSYHAALAAITLWGFWRSRTGWIRWPGAGLALATIAATPIDGGHYLVDVIAGLSIAVVSIAAARRLTSWRFRPGVRALPFRRSREAFAQ
jgi:membrane-associated phospholipid phosphatase